MSNHESSKLKMSRSDLLKAHSQIQGCIEEITSCQSEIDLLYEKQSEEQQKISQQFEDLKKPHISQRTELIRNIPKFWINAIERHPKLCLLLDDKAREILRYMTKIEMEDSVGYNDRDSYKIHFFFEENPYIGNDRITKELLLLEIEGTLVIRSSSTTIIWKSNMEGLRMNEEASSSICDGVSLKGKENNFFVWFCDNEKPHEDDNFSYFQAICETPLVYSPLFFDSSDEEVEEHRFRKDASDHASRVVKQVEDLNLNGDQNWKTNVDS